MTRPKIFLVSALAGAAVGACALHPYGPSAVPTPAAYRAGALHVETRWAIIRPKEHTAHEHHTKHRRLGA